MSAEVCMWGVGMNLPASQVDEGWQSAEFWANKVCHPNFQHKTPVPMAWSGHGIAVTTTTASACVESCLRCGLVADGVPQQRPAARGLGQGAEGCV